MFDLSTINKRYFSIKIGDLELEVEPPKLGVLKKITNLASSKDEDAMADLADAVRLILSKNKAKRKVSEKVIEDLDIDQMDEILTAYFEWLDKARSSKN